jgi:serine/threonine-protein kinase RsbW
MDTTCQLNATVGPDELQAITQFFAQTATRLGADTDAVSELAIALYEALVNILLHGYQQQPGPLMVLVMRQHDDLVVCVRDQAPHFDPTTVPTPNTAVPLEQRPYGGMGVHMMRHFADELAYRINDAGENELQLIKRKAFSEPLAS